MDTITIVGGGLAGLVAAIEAGSAGAPVRLLEAHDQLGGRGRSTPGEWKANYGPHVVYSDGALWDWLEAHELIPPHSRAPKIAKVVIRSGGRARRVPPLALVKGLRALRRAEAPVDVDFRTWAGGLAGDRAAELLSKGAGVFSFDHDPGRLSAAFVDERGRRALAFPPTVRYVHGGWSTMIAGLERRARDLGVVIATGTVVDALPEAPVIVATELAAARRLLGDDSLCWEGTRTVILDVGLRARRGDPFIVSDLDEAGWVERFSLPDPTLAPPGHSLVQGQLGLRAGESLDAGVARLEALLDISFAGWRQREVWRRRALLKDASGALDVPGTTWRDRPAVDRGHGVFLAGDMVAAPGLLSEVAVHSAIAAAAAAVAMSRGEVLRVDSARTGVAADR
jgi:putative NAD(P)-binding protein